MGLIHAARLTIAAALIWSAAKIMPGRCFIEIYGANARVETR